MDQSAGADPAQGAAGRASAIPPGVARTIRRRLLNWGRDHFQHYEWRAESDPWLTLVAEVLLARTRAPQAEREFARFRASFPRAADFAEISAADAAQVTSRLGLHWRGPLLHSAAQIVASGGGTPPATESELQDLPGVGPYAAAASLSLHRGKRAVIIDNNVARWLARLTGRHYDAETRRKRWVREVAEVLTPKRAFRAYNYAVLDFTMLVCRPRGPLCDQCPLASLCATADTERSAKQPMDRSPMGTTTRKHGTRLAPHDGLSGGDALL